MADSADVETALVTLISAAFYPNGTSQPSTIGTTVSVQRGWPTDDQATAATDAGAALITVHGDKGMARDATRYPRTWSGRAGTPTITASVSGLAITFAGIVSPGHIIAVQAAGVWFTYVVLPGDTLPSSVAEFATAIPDASASGATLTLPAYGDPPQVRVGMQGSSSQEVSRQQQAFRICIWAPSPQVRDAIYAVLPGAVAAADRLTAPDGSIITWMNQREAGSDDMPSRARMWRRDLLAVYDWPILNTQITAPLLLLGIELTTTEGLQIVQIGDVTYPSVVQTDADGNPLFDAVGDLLGVV